VKELDQSIVDAFGVVSLLLAFAAAYSAALWPIVSDLLTKQKPIVNADRQQDARRCRAYAWTMGTLAALFFLTGIMLTPLTIDVIQDFTFGGEFHTVRAGLVLVQVTLLSGTIVVIVLCRRLVKRKNDWS